MKTSLMILLIALTFSACAQTDGNVKRQAEATVNAEMQMQSEKPEAIQKKEDEMNKGYKPLTEFEEYVIVNKGQNVRIQENTTIIKKKVRMYVNVAKLLFTIRPISLNRTADGPVLMMK
jgi:flagellar basal body L-ring protein FlgH